MIRYQLPQNEAPISIDEVAVQLDAVEGMFRANQADGFEDSTFSASLLLSACELASILGGERYEALVAEYERIHGVSPVQFFEVQTVEA